MIDGTDVNDIGNSRMCFSFWVKEERSEINKV